MTIEILPGIAAIAEAYDGFVLDLWGVVHDGHKPYPDAVDCLARLHDARQGTGKRIVMLSNAPRRASGVIEAMAAMGIDRGLYDDVVTSGELTWQALKSREDTWHAALGRRFLHIGPARDHGLFEGLDLERVSSPQDAHFIVNTGPWRDEEQLEDYVPLLQECAKLHLPMICANPDLEVIRGGVRFANHRYQGRQRSRHRHIAGHQRHPCGGTRARLWRPSGSGAAGAGLRASGRLPQGGNPSVPLVDEPRPATTATIRCLFIFTLPPLGFRVSSADSARRV
jgi:HAD superfamily hydrolase (TIGR01459 family)